MKKSLITAFIAAFFLFYLNLGYAKLFSLECKSNELINPNGLTVIHNNGQTFITWKDRLTGKAGEKIRYKLFRSISAIQNNEDLKNAELIASGIFNHSGQLFGYAFKPEQRLDPNKPMAKIMDDAPPLPVWSGLWVATPKADGCAFYAVLATDQNNNPIEDINPGINATTTAVVEQIKPRQPILIVSSKDRKGPAVKRTKITGTDNLPLSIKLHGSNAKGGPAGTYGDYYLYFGDTTMGYQDGLPGIFSVEESRRSGTQKLLMRNRDITIVPEGSWYMPAMQTWWFGYVAGPINSINRHAYPYTENRLLWMISWIIEKYKVDKNRVYVFGPSMGASGTMTFAFRRPDLFAAVYPDRPRMRQWGMSSISGKANNEDTLPNGQKWIDHHDSVKFVESHPDDLPFLGWNIGRKDEYSKWKNHVDMVNALSNSRHGFAFAWSNKGHSDLKTRSIIKKWYPESKFARNISYPAFSNSTLDNKLGNGNPEDGDLEGGINLGFDWQIKSDTPTEWKINVTNSLVINDMQVDITPRRRQHFKTEPEEELFFEIKVGEMSLSKGYINVDSNNLITIKKVPIFKNKTTSLRITLKKTLTPKNIQKKKLI